MSALAEAASLYAGAAMVFVAAVWATSSAWDLSHWNEPRWQSKAMLKRGARWVRRQWRALR